MDIGGIGLGGVHSRGDEGKDSKLTEQAKAAQQFNPNAQVVSSGAQSALASMARLHMKNGKRADSINEDDHEIDEDEIEMEVATLGMMKLNQEQLQGFREKIEHSILRQEKEILNTVNMFAGGEKTLRNILSSLLLSF